MKPHPADPAPGLDYIRDPDAIYRASFAEIERTTDFSKLSPDLRPLAVRLVHACGQPEIIDHLICAEGAATAGRGALRAGANVIVDAEMVAHGIIGGRLPAGNDVLCTLNADGVRARAATLGWTRSATAVDLWRALLPGAVVAIGNAPTALFRLLELLRDGAPRPALILGFPVGFIGAAEAKEALIADANGVPFVTLRGRMGGSALAAAAVNALGEDAS